MKINANFDAIVLSKKENVTSEGKHYFNITVFCPESGEAGQLPCSESVFGEIKDSVLNKPVKIFAEYNESYKSFRITGITK